MHHITVPIACCPRCRTPASAVPDPVSGAVHCTRCGTDFDPRQGDTGVMADSAMGDPVPTDPGWEPAPGGMIGDYRLLGLLGRGGMATVWESEQVPLQRRVALKILNRELADDSDLRRRFRREAEALVQVDHPLIVRVLDAGEHAGRPFLVTALAGRHNLRDELMKADGRRLPPERVVRILSDVLDALAHAHARGLIHRDLKPENLIVGDDQHVRLVDFGIAQVWHAQDGHTLTQLTRTRMVMGTVAYMAPEQAEPGLPLDHRCDLYSLGVVAYEALCGHRPVGRFEDPSAVIGSQHPAGKAWNTLLLSLLERDPARRPADAATAQGLLRAISDTVKERPRCQVTADGVSIKAGPVDLEISRQGLKAKAGPVGVDVSAQGIIAKAGPVGVDVTSEGITATAGRHGVVINQDGIRSTSGPTRPAAPSSAADPLFPHGHRLFRDPYNTWLGGLLGGLAAWTGIYSGWWRLGFMVLIVISCGHVPGVTVTMIVGYVILTLLVPRCPDPPYRPKPLNHPLPHRHAGIWLGVCALLGHQTTLAPWIWRLMALLSLPFAWIPYLILGILLPSYQPPVPARPAPQPAPAPPTRPLRLERRKTRFWLAWGAVLVGCGMLLPQTGWTGLVMGTALGFGLALAGAILGTIMALAAPALPPAQAGTGTGGGMISGAATAAILLLTAIGPYSAVIADLEVSLVPAALVALAAIGLLLGLLRRRPGIIPLTLASTAAVGTTFLVWTFP